MSLRNFIILCIAVCCSFCFIQISSSDRQYINKNKAFSRYQTIYKEKLTLADDPTSYYISDPNGPGTYAYGYEINDSTTGNVQFKNEESFINGTIHGSYGYVQSNGILITTEYIADSNGYRSKTDLQRIKFDEH